MKFTETNVSTESVVLANDHYVATPYDCSEITANANGVIPAGTIIPANDATAKGVLLHDVIKAENPIGTMIIHGFIKASALPAAAESAAKAVLPQIAFM